MYSFSLEAFPLDEKRQNMFGMQFFFSFTLYHGGIKEKEKQL